VIKITHEITVVSFNFVSIVAAARQPPDLNMITAVQCYCQGLKVRGQGQGLLVRGQWQRQGLVNCPQDWHCTVHHHAVLFTYTILVVRTENQDYQYQIVSTHCQCSCYTVISLILLIYYHLWRLSDAVTRLVYYLATHAWCIHVLFWVAWQW